MQHTILGMFVLALVAFGTLFVGAEQVSAQKALQQFKTGAGNTIQGTGIQKNDNTNALPNLAGTLIGQILSLMGIVFFLITMIAGFFWMFALGNETRAQKAKDTIIAAVGGLIVIIGSYAITDFIFNTVQKEEAAVVEVNQGNVSPCGAGTYSNGICVDRSSCGGGRIFSNATCSQTGQVCCYLLDARVE